MNKLGFSKSQSRHTRRKRGLEIGLFHVLIEPVAYTPSPTKIYICPKMNIEVTVYAPGFAFGTKNLNNL